MTLEDELRFEDQLETEIARHTRSLRQQVSALNAENRELQAMLGFYSAVEAAVLEPPKWTVSPRSSKHHTGIVVAQLTDTHFDEIVKPEEVNFINAYNRHIAELRLRRWVDKVITQVRDYVSGVEIEGLFLAATGDLLSGDIHAELKESNEDHLYASAVHWIEHLIAAIELFAEEFGQVHIGAVVGNHGRSTHKPVFKGRAHTNIEWFLWRVIAARLADRGRTNITVQVSDAMDLTIPMYGFNYLLTHGDQFKGGTGISGALAPLMLGQHRKSVREMATATPMNRMIMGHFHQLLTLPGLTVGGSMKGYDEYAFGLNLRPEESAQAMWITTPERGPTVSIPIFLQKRAEEGW